ncbi:hypothetical protein A2963_02180 [Candidatus Roizmanbacteria bacterium RIFCSPLOWO2_01_FULL_40_13]|nr:MAG: hypothetical protein A2963_02180 [Candidatus Roizmanbacteria bacterium RIFCSPLOWO2_01_FULL_40_13]
MKKILPHLLPILIIIALSIVVHHVWFFNLSPITYGDWTIDYAERSKELFSLPLIWKTENNLGSVDLGVFFWPLQFLLGLLSQLNLPPPLVERLLTLWPVAIITPLSMYFLAYSVFRTKLPSFVASIVFTYNTILIVARSGPVLLNLALSFSPLFLLFYMRALEEKKVGYALVSALIAFIISFSEIRLFYVLVWIALLYFIYHMLIIKPNFKTGIRIFSFVLISLSLPILLNLYGILSLLNLQSLTANEVFNRALFGGFYIDLTKIMSLFHYDWTGGKIEGWVVQPIPLRFFIIPVFAFLGFVLSRQKKITFFALLALLTIFLTKLNHPPFPDVYQWLFDSVPGFSAFRESGKFAYFMVLSYAVLIASFVHILLEKNKQGKAKIPVYVLISFIIFLFLWNTKPVITGELGSLYVQRNIPNDYLILKKFILEQKQYFRTFWIPLSSQWGIRTNNHPVVSNYHLNQSNWKEFIQKSKSDVFGINFNDRLLDLTSVKYVIVPLQDKKNDDDFFRFAGNRESYVQELDSSSYLTRIEVGTAKVLVYENNNFRPHLYATKIKESIKRPVPFYQIDSRFIAPHEYQIKLTDITAPFYLNFSESYDSGWKLRAGSFNWFRSILDKDYFLSDEHHFVNDAKLNSFYIDPRAVCNLQTCYTDEYGNTRMDLVLFFKPQAYVYLGLIISGLTFIILISVLIYFFHVFPSSYLKYTSSKIIT